MTPTARIRTELRHLVRELGLLNRNCLNSGMTLSQAHILTYINKNGPTPFTELQLQLGLDKASCSRTVNALRERGYLRLVNDRSDKRAKHVELLPSGSEAIAVADRVANGTVEGLLSDCDDDAWTGIYDALRRFRLSALRTNLAANPKRVRIEPLRDAYFDSAMELAIRIFSREQHIPRRLVPVPKKMHPKWWCIRVGEDVIGVAAAWREGGQWHWGRFAVDPSFRGMGIGKKIALESIAALFSGVTDRIVVEARDITVGIIERMGGIQTQPSFDFYGEPVTPMTLEKGAFLRNTLDAERRGG